MLFRLKIQLSNLAVHSVMLVVMEQEASPEQIENVVNIIEARGMTARPIPGGERVSIGILNNRGPVDPGMLMGLPGVKEAIPVFTGGHNNQGAFSRLRIKWRISCSQLLWLSLTGLLI